MGIKFPGLDRFVKQRQKIRIFSMGSVAPKTATKSKHFSLEMLFIAVTNNPQDSTKQLPFFCFLIFPGKGNKFIIKKIKINLFVFYLVIQ